MNANNTVIVIPCYNEAERLRLGRFRSFLNSHDEYRVLFVDDGSSDDTARLLRQLRDGFPDQVSIVTLARNQGKAEAVRQGILLALDSAPSAVAYWDADLATPLEEVPRFRRTLDHRDQVRVVMGCRLRLAGHDIRRTQIRCTLGRLFSTIASLVLGRPLRDTQCGAKMFRVTPDLRPVFECPFVSRWIFDVEILGRMMTSGNLQGGSLLEMPLIEWTEVPGSKLSTAHCLMAVRELMQIGWRLRLDRNRVGNRPERPADTRAGDAGRGPSGPSGRICHPPDPADTSVTALPDLAVAKTPRRAA